MAKFKVGDRVKVLDFRGSQESPNWVSSMDRYVGTEQVIEGIDTEGVDFQTYSWNFKWLELITNNQSNMSIINKIKLFKKGEPEKSNIKAGLRTVDDEFTSEGKEAFLEFLYQANKAAFKTEVADPINAELEAEKK